jgi:hypothetical protein
MNFIVDQEEFRIDKSVRISRKEYNDLMNELYEFTESYIEFNGGNVGELLETNAVITDFENDKVIKFFFFYFKNKELV